jgi:hypothetical protein
MAEDPVMPQKSMIASEMCFGAVYSINRKPRPFLTSDVELARTTRLMLPSGNFSQIKSSSSLRRFALYLMTRGESVRS